MSSSSTESSTTSVSSFAGPTYDYYKYVKTPSQMGMNSKGTSITTDFVGLVEYIKLLISGDSKASTTGRPLGDKFFLKTMGTCKAVDTGETVDRYVYFNNVPMGDIPFIKQGLGVNFTELRGLVPGSLSTLNKLDPSHMYHALVSGPKPDCTEITMQVIDEQNKKSTEKHYVANTDIEYIDPCLFSNKKNPVSGQKCIESFTSNSDSSSSYAPWNQNNFPLDAFIPNYTYIHTTFQDNPIGYVFLMCYCFIALFLFYRLCCKFEIPRRHR